MKADPDDIVDGFTGFQRVDALFLGELVGRPLGGSDATPGLNADIGLIGESPHTEVIPAIQADRDCSAVLAVERDVGRVDLLK